MIDTNEYLEAGLKLHGHKCPAMPMGLRAGAGYLGELIGAVLYAIAAQMAWKLAGG